MKKWIALFILSFQCFMLNADHGIVVCIHGFLTTSRSMKPIEGALKFVGYQIWNWDYPSNRRTIEEHGCALAAYLQDIAYCHPGEPINFVTHSTGALILRAALNTPGCPNEAKIGRAALIAPPNQGTQLGYRFRNFPLLTFLMGEKSGYQLLNYTAEDIRCHFGSFPPCMDVLVIAGTKGIKLFFHEPNDGFLSVDETALDTPFYWVSYPLKHGDLISCPPVLCCVRKFLCWGYPACGCTTQ